MADTGLTRTLSEMGMEVDVQVRVVGQPNPIYSKGKIAVEFPPYRFTWTKAIAVREGHSDAMSAALHFIERMTARGPWTDGPRIEAVRTVASTRWEAQDG